MRVYILYIRYIIFDLPYKKLFLVLSVKNTTQYAHISRKCAIFALDLHK